MLKNKEEQRPLDRPPDFRKPSPLKPIPIDYSQFEEVEEEVVEHREDEGE